MELRSLVNRDDPSLPSPDPNFEALDSAEFVVLTALIRRLAKLSKDPDKFLVCGVGPLKQLVLAGLESSENHVHEHKSRAFVDQHFERAVEFVRAELVAIKK